MVATIVPAVGQNYYDDDIYGTPKRAEKKQPVQAPAPADYAPADSYTVVGSRNVSVDEYNRHGNFLVGDSVAADSVDMGDTFAYTRRIERFHNPDVVTESGDTTLCDYYYSTPATTVNIYVDNSYPYYSYNWAWRYGNPWYWNVYGPAYIGWGGWSWGWYDPIYDPYPWGWSWGWSWGGPGWGWGPGWGYGPGWGPSYAYRPSSPGASMPHRPTTGSGASLGRNPGGNYTSFTGASRPGNMGRPTGSASNSIGLRPGISTTAGGATAHPGTRPNASQGTYTPYGAGSRGRGSSEVSTGSSSNHNYATPSNNSYRNNNSNNRNNSNVNSSSSSRSSYGSSGSSRSSYGSGSSGTRGGGSSGRSSGGGGGRGRR